MELCLLGWPPDGPRLRLDHREFAYAGKFVTSNTGKAVAVEGDLSIPDPREAYAEGVVAAVAFNEDRTDPGTLWLRYVTVRADRRGEGIGPRLCAFVRERGLERGHERFRIAVNNPFAYEALYRARFAFTGRETGLAELVLEYPGDRSETRYRDGLSRFRDRLLSDSERSFLNERGGVPSPLPDS
jgi:GNAT superfamily N-acetyltransferase